MSILTGSADTRHLFDRVLIGLIALVLALVFALGFLAIGVGFVTTAAYEQQLEWISFACGVVAAACGGYLILEYPGRRSERVVLFLVAACGIFGYLAASNGFPAALTLAHGVPGTERFTMVGLEGGSRSCRGTVVAQHPRYSEMRICINHFGDRRPAVGDTIEVSGKISQWGITRDGFRAL